MAVHGWPWPLPTGQCLLTAAQLLPLFLLQNFSGSDHHGSPKTWGPGCFSQLLCQPCSLCVQKAWHWLVWQPSSEHGEMLSGGQALWRRHPGCGGDENSRSKEYEKRAGKTQAIICSFGKVYFAVSNGFLEAKYLLMPIYNSMCFSRRGKKNHGNLLQKISRQHGYMDTLKLV